MSVYHRTVKKLSSVLPQNIVKSIMKEALSNQNKYNILLTKFKNEASKKNHSRGKLLIFRNELVGLRQKLPPGSVNNVPPLPRLKHSVASIKARYPKNSRTTIKR